MSMPKEMRIPEDLFDKLMALDRDTLNRFASFIGLDFEGGNENIKDNPINGISAKEEIALGILSDYPREEVEEALRVFLKK
jgi:hypothetical protein